MAQRKSSSRFHDAPNTRLESIPGFQGEQMKFLIYLFFKKKEL